MVGIICVLFLEDIVDKLHQLPIECCVCCGGVGRGWGFSALAGSGVDGEMSMASGLIAGTRFG